MDDNDAIPENPQAANVEAQQAAALRAAVKDVIRAVERGNLKAATELATGKDSAFFALRDENGKTPLTVAARRDARMLAFFLGRGAKPDAADGRGVTALTAAIIAGREQNVRLLVDAGASLNPVAGLPPLEVAARHGTADMMQFLIDRGAKAEAPLRGQPGKGGMLLVAAVGAIDAEKKIGMLLKAGANVNAKDEKGHTALAHALMRSANGVAEMLVDAGAVFDQPLRIRSLISPHEGLVTPLTLAVKSGKEERVRAELAKTSRDLDTPDLYGYTPLMYAVHKNQLEIARLLLAAGADVAPRRANGQSARDIAAGLQGYFSRTQEGAAKVTEILRLIDVKTHESVGVAFGRKAKDGSIYLGLSAQGAPLFGLPEKGLLAHAFNNKAKYAAAANAAAKLGHGDWQVPDPAARAAIRASRLQGAPAVRLIRSA